MVMWSENEMLGNTIEIEGRERVWTPNLSFFLKKAYWMRFALIWNVMRRVECADPILSQ